VQLYYDHDRIAITSQTERIRSIDQCIRNSCAPSQDDLSSKYVRDMCAQTSHVDSRFVNRQQHWGFVIVVPKDSASTAARAFVFGYRIAMCGPVCRRIII
jgi:hypothetical protein